MNPPRTSPTPAVLAPGASTHGAYAPANNARLPAVDERLVAPEAHAEILDGRVYRTMGANPPHATQHFDAAALFAGVLAEGYRGAVDMLTRADDDSDAAPDVSVFPSALDPRTGGRQLEEIAFEVLDTERLAHTTDKIEKFAKRGVRRLFAVKVASRKVYEWDHAHHDWTELDADAEITDRCFRVPLPVAALVDRVLADDTVAKALLASRNRVIERELAAREARGEARGEARAVAASILRVLARRAVSVDDQTRARVLDCDDRETLDAWLDRAVTATAARDLFDA
ncbi:MAG: Uma2 family endonuclease [Polyangiales bacterium]